MAFSRRATVAEIERGDALTRAMAGIGMHFAAEPAEEPNIEDTLVAASIEGMEHDDLRTLSVLVTWLEAHRARINADRLLRALSGSGLGRTLAFWAAFAAWQRGDRRFARIACLHHGAHVELLRAGNDFQTRRRGEDERFRGTCLSAPRGALRDRSSDVDTPSELARRHGTYRWRVVMGPSYRADMWAALCRDPGLSASDLARRTYGSFATAWQVKRDFALVGSGPLSRSRARRSRPRPPRGS